MKLVNRDTQTNTIKLNNVGAKPVYLNFNANPGSSVPASLTLAKGQSQAVSLENGWAGAVFAGLEANNLANNKIEATFQGGDGTTFFDVDVEKGFSVPVVCTSGDGLVTSGCSLDKLPSCPATQRLTNASGATVACSNPQTADAIALMRAGCPNEYVVWDDVQTKATSSHLISCDIGVPVAADVPQAPVATPKVQTTQAPVATETSSTITRTKTRTVIVTQTPALAAKPVQAVDTTRQAGASTIEESSSGALIIPQAANIFGRSLAHANTIGATSAATCQAPLPETLLFVGLIGALMGKKLLS